MNIKVPERLLNALIVGAAIVQPFVVGYTHYKETSPSSVEIRPPKILDCIVVPPQTMMKRLTDLKGTWLGYVVSDRYLIDMILKELANENIINITAVSQPEEVSSACAAGVDALYLLDLYRGHMVYKGNTIILEGPISCCASHAERVFV